MYKLETIVSRSSAQTEGITYNKSDIQMVIAWKQQCWETGANNCQRSPGNRNFSVLSDQRKVFFLSSVGKDGEVEIAFPEKLIDQRTTEYSLVYQCAQPHPNILNKQLLPPPPPPKKKPKASSRSISYKLLYTSM